MQHGDLTERIIGCAMTVHSHLGPGYLESVYGRALMHELLKAGLKVECQTPIEVAYDGVVVGSFVADMFVNGAVLVEIKAVQSLHPIAEAQLVNYLTATRVDVGLLLNFGTERLCFKRKHRTYRPRTSSVPIL
jgi:GxxExxY protein